MLEVAVACAMETNISQEHVLQRFTSSISDVHSRRPHQWNLYQSYAQHEFNRTTELQRTVEGCETSPDTEVAPLTKAQLSEAYTQFVLDYGDDKAEEILAKHSELVAAEEGPTVEGRQQRFGSLMRRWGGTVCPFDRFLISLLKRSPQLESIEARDDFQALFMMAGLHVHQDSEYAEVRYTEGFARVRIYFCPSHCFVLTNARPSSSRNSSILRTRFSQPPNQPFSMWPIPSFMISY
jgi:hypothetical protein